MKSKGKRDQRVVNVSITEAGWVKLGRSAPMVFGAEKELSVDLTRRDLRELSRLLAKL
jgi:DNA-binding MarR family transcriptional regulator